MTIKRNILISALLVFTPFFAQAQINNPVGTKYDANGDIIYSTPTVLATTTITVATSSQASLSYERNLQAGTERQQTVRLWRSQSTELQQKINTLNAIATSSVSMPILFGVSLRDITPNFGVSRDGGSRTHEGEDIMGLKGTPVVSPTNAVVLRMGTGPTEGNFVSTANPGGETFVYMHLDRIGEGVEVGKSLQAGDLIGYLGDTGNAIGGPSHLHFEIRNSNGIAIDPFPRLTVELSSTEKMIYLSRIFAQSSDPNALAQFLVLHFRDTFTQVLNQGVAVPVPVTNLLSGVSINTNTTPTTTSLPAGGSLILPRNLFLGIRGDDVMALQKFLNLKGFIVTTTGFGSVGYETTYFGPATRAAVIRFQIANQIFPTAGYVGLLTRGVIQGLHY